MNRFLAVAAALWWLSGAATKVSPPGGDREVIRQTTLDFLKQERAQIAINGHFFLPFPSADPTAWARPRVASSRRSRSPRRATRW